MSKSLFAGGISDNLNKRVKKMDSLSEDKYIDIDEAANYLGIKPVTLRVWIKKNTVPAHRIGKMWKFKRSELDVWVSSGKSAIWVKEN